MTIPATPIDEQDLQAGAEKVLGDAISGSALEPVKRLQGGTSSITYRATLNRPGAGSEEVVLKVGAAAGLAPVKNRNVLRQARLQKAPDQTGVPVPRPGPHTGDLPKHRLFT